MNKLALNHVLASILALAAAGCSDPAPAPPAGVDVEPGACGHALYVISSDYQSTSVAIVSYDGEVLASSLISSGSETTGLSTPLSATWSPHLRT